MFLISSSGIMMRWAGRSDAILHARTAIPKRHRREGLFATHERYSILIYMAEQTAIESLSTEHRLFPPPADFAAAAHIKSFEEYEELYAEAAADPQAFWATQAESLRWSRKWDTVLEWNEPHAKWFDGGTLNVADNCLDRHTSTSRKNKAAIIWEGETGEIKTITYLQLQRPAPTTSGSSPSATSTGTSCCPGVPSRSPPTCRWPGSTTRD